MDKRKVYLFTGLDYWTVLYVLLKALLPVCLKYTARDESRVASIARGEAECYICHDSHQELYTFIQTKWQVYFTLTKVSAKYSSLIILTHLLNKKTIFFDKMCQ